MLHTHAGSRPLLPGVSVIPVAEPPGRAWTTRPGTPLHRHRSGQRKAKRTGPDRAPFSFDRPPTRRRARLRARRRELRLQRVQEARAGPPARTAIARWRDGARVAREVREQLQLALAAERAGVRPAGVDERRQAARGRARSGRGAGRAAARGCRRGRRGSGSRRAPRARAMSSGSAMLAERLEAHEALDERDQRGGVADARLRVHHAHLERAELGLQAHVPPDERRLGDRAAADQHVDRPRRSRRRSPNSRGMPVRGKAWKTGVRALASPLSRPRVNGRVGRQREQHRDVRAHAVERAHGELGVGHGDVHVQRERRLAPGELAQRLRAGTGSGRPGETCDVLGARPAGACPRPRRAARAPRTVAASPARMPRSSRGGLADGARAGRWRARAPARASRRGRARPARSGRTRSTSSERHAGEPSGSSSMTSSSTPTVHGSRSGFDVPFRPLGQDRFHRSCTPA